MSNIVISVERKPKTRYDELIVLFNNFRYAVEINRDGDLLTTGINLSMLAQACFEAHADKQERGGCQITDVHMQIPRRRSTPCRKP